MKKRCTVGAVLLLCLIQVTDAFLAPKTLFGSVKAWAGSFIVSRNVEYYASISDQEVAEYCKTPIEMFGFYHNCEVTYSYASGSKSNGFVHVYSYESWTLASLVPRGSVIFKNVASRQAHGFLEEERTELFVGSGRENETIWKFTP